MPESNASTIVKDIFGVGGSIKSAAEAYTEMIPGRKIVSAARAQIKVDELLDKRTEVIVAKAKEEHWPSEYLAMRLVELFESVGRRANLEHVVAYAKTMVDDDKAVDEETIADVDSEWLNYFIDHSEKCTTADMQIIWGAILAGEINGKGAVSKKAMSILADMDKEDVRAFRRLCSFAFDLRAESFTSKVLAMSLDEGFSTYNEGRITWQEVSELSSLGLVEVGGARSLSIKPGQSVLVMIADSLVEIKHEDARDKKLSFDPVLTRAGEELSSLCEQRDYEGMIIALKDKARHQGFILTELFGEETSPSTD